MVQRLGSPGLVVWKCSSLWSLHCWEPEVFAALWNQRHAVPSRLRTKRHRPSPMSRGTTLSLERAGQHIAANRPAKQAVATFHHFGSPTWVTSWRHPTQQTIKPVRLLYKLDFFMFYPMWDIQMLWPVMLFPSPICL